MKIVNLNLRHNAFKKYRFKAGLRFNEWNHQSRAVELYLKERYQRNGWRPSTWDHEDIYWYGEFGRASTRFGNRPYWVYLRNSEDVSMLLLSGVLDQT